MSSLRSSLKAMKSEETWNDASSEFRAVVAQHEEERRREAARQADLEERRREAERLQKLRETERQRQELFDRAPKLVDEIFATMKKGTRESIAEAQQLLGDRSSDEPMAVLYREVIGNELRRRIEDENNPKARSGDMLYQKLHDFLRVAHLGYESAEQLQDAFSHQDEEGMLKAMFFTAELKVADQQKHGACAAAIAFILNEDDWRPKVWPSGFEALKFFAQKALELRELREKAAAIASTQEEASEAEPATHLLSKAS